MRLAVDKCKTAVYVDGYNLYYGRLRNTAYKWLDLPTLFDRLMAVQDPTASVEMVRFFTAPALANFATHGQYSVNAQNSYHRALSIRHPDRFSITLGSHSMDRQGSLLPAFQEGRPYDRKVRTRVWRIEEKKTDVNLALAMYRDACKQVYGQMVLCSNDSDAEPVLAALREDFPDLRIGVVAPVPPRTERRFSASLANLAHWTRRHILDEELAAAQLSAVVATKKKPIRKPEHC